MWRVIKREASLFWSTVNDIAPSWDFAKAFFRSPLFSIAALLPILGYIIIAAEGFVEGLLASTESSDSIAEFIGRITDLYWGAYCYILAYIIYATSCPPLVKSARDKDGYRDLIRATNTRRLTVNFIFNSARNESFCKAGKPHANEYCECVRLWVSKVMALGSKEQDFSSELDYLLCRSVGVVAAKPEIQARLKLFQNRLLELSVKYHHKDPWIVELEDNIASIVYETNARHPSFFRLMTNLNIAIGTLYIFGTVIINHFLIVSSTAS